MLELYVYGTCLLCTDIPLHRHAPMRLLCRDDRLQCLADELCHWIIGSVSCRLDGAEGKVSMMLWGQH